ncbi:hypothetical protein [Hyphobacterium marinum]|uniref:YD repeat-containing protein n=1 Tax=Hyphobacterium marinum TaxID=3116574 RepID=A0ABU7M1D9_9PROT|nr:hypothetical protein [Hyphobacterium sp. Y6023]MEE2567075.1 hypothetical protein [Hyphobacterium sp. Y6023]
MTSYAYDSTHRLLTLSHDLSGATNDVTFTYAYNPAGQIISRTISNDNYVFGGFANEDVTDQHNGLNQLT